MKNSQFTCCLRRSFTLFELLLVLAILSILSAGVAALVSSDANQSIDNNNRTRLEQIRIAICGDPSTLSTRNPVVSGFVADMGRLPSSIDELLTAPSGSTWTTDAQGNGYGWRGPYLQIPVASRFLDAWGNDDGSLNFGWKYPVDPSTSSLLSINTLNGSGGSFRVQSLGQDGALGGSGYDADLSLSITDTDYRVPLSSLKIRVAFTELTSGLYNTNFNNKTTIRLAFISDANANLTWTSTTPVNGILATDWVSDPVTMPATASMPTSLASSILTFDFANAKKAPWGRRYPAFIDTALAGTTLKLKIIAVARPQTPMFLFPRGTPLTNETLMFLLK